MSNVGWLHGLKSKDPGILKTLPSEKLQGASGEILNWVVAAGALEHLDVQLPGAIDAYQKILNHMNEPTHRTRYNLERRLPYIKGPTLIIWGSEDKVNDISMGEMMHSLIPHSEMAVIPCGHFCPSETPREVNAQMIQFIHKHLGS